MKKFKSGKILYIFFLLLIIILISSFFCSKFCFKLGKGETKTLSLVTYNVLADPIFEKERVPALLDILKKSDADIIALQEVAPWFVKILEKEPWITKYKPLKLDEELFIAHEFLILSKYEIESIALKKLPGKQGRMMFIANIKVNGKKMNIATCHLESRLDDGEVRAKQLELFFKNLPPEEDAIFMGDFNFGDGEEPDSSHLDKNFQDLWLKLRPKEPGYTWNIEISNMAQKGSFPNEKSRRIDRILMKSGEWHSSKIEIIGDEPISKDKKHIFPSDHFGLKAEIILEK